MVRKPSPEKRALFLDAALRLFVANGVQNTSTAAISQEAGTAAGTLFLYFPTKQVLIDELVLEIGKNQSESIQALLEPGLPARENFFRIWEGSIHWFLENRAAYQYFQQVRNSKLVSSNAIQESEKFFGYYFNAIQKGLEQGSIKPYPLELVGEMLYRDIEAVMNLVGLTEDPATQAEYIRSGFEIFWNGIKA